MNYKLTKNGFSLTEVLIAVGILAVGLVFIAGTFPVGIGLTTIAAERTIGAVAADEAFTKIRLCRINLFDPDLEVDELTDFSDVASTQLDLIEFAYPSVDSDSPHSYYWTALCRKIDDSGLAQVTVFVCRKTGINTRYPINDPDDDVNAYDWPRPVPVRGLRVDTYPDGEYANRFRVHGDIAEQKRFFIAGSTIISDKTGSVYRVLDRDKDNDRIVKLDRDVQRQDLADEERRTIDVWVVPPAVGGGRNPTIGVYQRVIKF